MRTEEDIRAALTSLERRAPDPDAILRAVRTRTGTGPATGPGPAPGTGRRWRRRHGLAAGAAAVAGAAAITAAALGTGQADVSLAAWSVHVRGGGDIVVSVRQWRDLPALQATLRADGVDARLHTAPAGQVPCAVGFTGAGENPQIRILDKAVMQRFDRNHSADELVIHPAAIPAGDKLLLYLAGPDSTSPMRWLAGIERPGACSG
jgi:hypothetical protein